MSLKSKKIVNTWIQKFVPKDMPFGDVEKLAKAAGLNAGSIRQIRSRESVSADTIISILLARGVSEEFLMSLEQTSESKISKHLSEWNQLGNSLTDKQREQMLKLCKFLLNEWKLK